MCDTVPSQDYRSVLLENITREDLKCAIHTSTYYVYGHISMKQPWIYVTEYREDIKEIHITTNYLTFNNSRFSTIVFCSKPVIPKPTVRSTVLGEGTNSTRLFTPRETKALASLKFINYRGRG